MPEKTGTFVVTRADQDQVVLSDVTDRQVHTVDSNPDLAESDVLEATIETVPPMDVVWTFVDIEDQREIEVTVTDERPTKPSREIADDLDIGDLHTRERADYGEIHVLAVPESNLEAAVEDVAEDQETVIRAARMGIRRVEIRADDGVLAIRYLP